MGLNAALKFLLPKEDRFIPYFEQAADNLKKASGLYVRLSKVNSREEMIALRDELKVVEHAGDEITHKIFEDLNLSFITPFDREDIYTLAKRMDDVLDLVYHVSELLIVYQFDKVGDGIAPFLEVTDRAISEIYQSIRLLRRMQYDSIRDHIVRVHDLENEGDRLYRLFVSELFATEKDAIRLLKYSSIYDEMEQTIDKCEDLMDSVEAIMLKNA